MVSNSDLFLKDSISELIVPKCVYLPNGSTTQVTHVGSCELSPRSVISNAFHIPDFKHNLLFVSKITK